MNNYKILVTGGAGFIGSNLIRNYINDSNISLIRVVDDLSTGDIKNIEQFLNNPKFEFINADICNYNVCLEITKDIDKVSHHAALGSVPRSIENPCRSTEVNILGTVNLMHACYINKVERIILACSSSTYGDIKDLPKSESRIGSPLSPYAITKFAIELYADVFNKTYGLKYIAFRYFNVFGPRQNPNNSYAAVIPLFCKSFILGISPIINGTGSITRDFTHIDNVVKANHLALFTENEKAFNQIYNVACGDQISLNEIISILNEITGNFIRPEFRPVRTGDIKHSKADISKIKNLLQYEVSVPFFDGLQETYKWYLDNKTFL